MRFRSYKKNKKIEFLSRGIIVLIISFICSLLVIRYMTSGIEEVLLPMATDKVKKIVTTMINDATEGVSFDKELFVINKDQNDEIKMITYNSYEVTKLINEITFNIQSNIEELINGEENELNGYLIQEVPFGSIFNSPLLRNLGPKIKVKSEIMGNIVSNIETEVKPYGINNAYVETRVFLEVSARIYLPFITDEIKISNVIPVSMNIVQGNVPQGYITSYK